MKPVLNCMHGDIAMFTVPSSKGDKTYHPCIEVGGNYEVICDCPHTEFLVWPKFHNQGAIVVIDNPEYQCRHIKMSIIELANEIELYLKRNQPNHDQRRPALIVPVSEDAEDYE